MIVGTVVGPLDRIVVDVQSPDRNISVAMRGRGDVEMRFAPGSYNWYEERLLAFQLGALATSTWVEFRRRYVAALSEEVGYTVRGDDTSYSPKVVKYRQELAGLTLAGSSPQDWVHATSTGLVRWEFTVREGACRRLREHEFIAEARGAVRAVLADYGDKVREVHTRMASTAMSSSDLRR